jgi:hypothetical protein
MEKNGYEEVFLRYFVADANIAGAKRLLFGRRGTSHRIKKQGQDLAIISNKAAQEPEPEKLLWTHRQQYLMVVDGRKLGLAGTEDVLPAFRALMATGIAVTAVSDDLANRFGRNC